jgi:hypothetical protein
MARMVYRITSRTETIEPFTVHAESYEHAAQIAARCLYGRKTGTQAVRVTGHDGKSGYFQAYLPCPTGELNSHGRNFHVMEA